MPDFADPEIFRTVLEGLPLGVYLVDRDRKIMFWNDGAEKITGYFRQEVLGHFCRDIILVHCDEDRSVLCTGGCPLLEAMRDGQPREADVFLRHREGHRLPVRVRAVPIRDRHGVVIGAAESFREQHRTPSPDRRTNNLEAHGWVDEITGLPVHAFMEFLLRQALAPLEGNLIPFAVLRIQVDQLDRFKAQHGQGAANAVLHVLARSLTNALRPRDILGRWTEDQFLAIVPFCNAMEQLAARWRKIVGCSTIPWWGDQLSVTISIGGTAHHPGDTMESILQRTESALQQSVARGGDGFTAAHE